MKIAITMWKSHGRDFEMLLPVIVSLNIKGHITKCFNTARRHKIINWNPDLILQANNNGAMENVELMKLAFRSSIPTISMISEGLFREDDIEEFVWGWNKEKLNLDHKILFWSDMQRNLALKYYPELRYNSIVTGNTTVDKYFYKPQKKPVYDIGYAGFDFTKFNHDKKYLKLANEQKQLLSELSKNYKILFRKHPGDGELKSLELPDNFKELGILIEGNEVSIKDSIEKCKLWLSFNSSTSIDALILNRQPLIYNSDEEIKFSELADAIPRVNKHNCALTEIDHLLLTQLDPKDNTHLKKLQKYYGHFDGLNHLRVVNVIESISTSVDRNLTTWEKIKFLILDFLFIQSNKLKIIKYYFTDHRKKSLVKNTTHYFSEDEVLNRLVNEKKYIERFYKENKCL